MRLLDFYRIKHALSRKTTEDARTELSHREIGQVAWHCVPLPFPADSYLWCQKQTRF